ncbi:MAG: AAA family ATPase, partial [Anaerolineales bacterium]
EQIAALHAVRKTGEGRWPALRSLAGHELATTHKPAEEILEYVQTFNLAYCDPPYPKEEVARLVADLAAKQQGKPREETRGDPVVLSLADVEPLAPAFLWRPYLLRGPLNVVAGPPGVGKSFLLIDTSARLTSGRNLFGLGVPGWTGNRPGRVLFMGIEDDAAILRWRFDKQGGDPSRFDLFSTKVRGGREDLVTLADDMPTIEQALRDRAYDMVIIDNVAAFIGNTVNTWKFEQVRPVLTPLAQVATERETAVVLVMHFAKGERARALERLSGTADFGYLPRSILFVDNDPNEEGRQVMVHAKASYSEAGAALQFAIDDDGLRWLGAADTKPEDLQRPEAERSSKADRTEAEEFLAAALANGPREAVEIATEAWKLGISKWSLRVAKRRLGVESVKDGLVGWTWRLPTPPAHRGEVTL